MHKGSSLQALFRARDDSHLMVCLFLTTAFLLLLLAVEQTPHVVLPILALALMGWITRIMGRRLCSDLQLARDTVPIKHT